MFRFRRVFFQAAILWILLAPGSAAPTAELEKAPRPNILLLMTDQQRFDSLSCYGCPALETPHLDRLAREGALFERCYAPSSICTPVRASLMTGKPLPGHGVYRLHDILPDSEVMLPKRLQAEGYETALVGKLHVSGLWQEAEVRHPNDGFEHYLWCIDPGLNFDSPFNAYARWVEAKDPQFYERLKREGKQLRHFPAELHFSTWAAETTIELIENRDKERPLFIHTSLFDPHDPYYDHPLQAAERIDVAAIEPPQPLPDDPARPEGVQRELAKSRAVLAREDDPNAAIGQVRKGYYASIAFFDEQLGRVLDCLDREGLTENTIVVFISDHGDLLYDRGLFTKGAYFYDPGVRVPLLMRWPGRIRPGVRVPQLVQHMDVTATLAAAAGYSRKQLDAIYPHSMDLVKLIDQGSDYDRLRPWAVSAFRNSGYGPGGTYFDPPIHATMLHDGRYKLTVYHNPQLNGRQFEGELYDMQDDPGETRNLWGNPAHARVRAALLHRLLDLSIESEIRLGGSRGGERFRRSVMKEYEDD